MTNQGLKQLVKNVNWSIYDGVEGYDSKIVNEALFELIDLEKLEEVYSQSIEHKMISAIGNDHRGTFYPAILSALDILIEIAKFGSFKSSRSALAILDNLCASFFAETGNYTNHSADYVNSYFIEALHSNMTFFQQQSSSGCKLTKGLVEEIELRLTSRANSYEGPTCQ